MYFRGLDGCRLERDTNQTGSHKAREAVRAIPDEEYAPSSHEAQSFSWDKAAKRLNKKAEVDGRRGPTIDCYQKLIPRNRKFYLSSQGPANISAGIAEAWEKTFSATKTRRRKLPSPHKVFSLLRSSNALWQTWFVEELGICTDNPSQVSACEGFILLPGQDSNLDKENQNLLCYRYTTGYRLQFNSQNYVAYQLESIQP